MAGCFHPFHLPHISAHYHFHRHARKKSKSLEELPQNRDMTLLQNNKLPSKLGRLFRSKSEQGLKGEHSPKSSPRTDSRPQRRLLRVVRDDQSQGEEWENPHVVRRYTKQYWESQMSEAKALQHSTSMPYTVNTDHTILKKTQSVSTDSENEGNISPSIGKHACFKEQVQVIEFADKEKITKHMYNMHEAALLEEAEEGIGAEPEDAVIDSCQSSTSRHELRRECQNEFTRARDSLDQCEDSSDTEPHSDSDRVACSDPGLPSDLSDTDEPKKKHKKKKLHLHMAAWFSGSSDHKDSDSDSEGRRVKRVNKKLLSTHLQTEVDHPEQ